MCQSTGPLSALCVFVCMCVCLCVISNQHTSKKPHDVSGLSKLDALLHKTHIKVLLVLRYQCLTCVDPLLSLSKIAYQMWHDHPFSQRNRTKEKTVGQALEVTGKCVGGWGCWCWVGKQNLKKEGVNVIQGALHKLGDQHLSASYEREFIPPPPPQ